jgi:hypothetical protein
MANAELILVETSKGVITGMGNTYKVEMWKRPGEPVIFAPVRIDASGKKMYLQRPENIQLDSAVDRYGFRAFFHS